MSRSLNRTIQCAVGGYCGYRFGRWLRQRHSGQLPNDQRHPHRHTVIGVLALLALLAITGMLSVGVPVMLVVWGGWALVQRQRNQQWQRSNPTANLADSWPPADSEQPAGNFR